MTMKRATFLLFIHLLVVDSFLWYHPNDTRPLTATTDSAEGHLEGTNTNIVDKNSAENGDIPEEASFDSEDIEHPVQDDKAAEGHLEGTNTNIVDKNSAENGDIPEEASFDSEDIEHPVQDDKGLEVAIVFTVILCALFLGLGVFLYVRHKRTRNAGFARVKLTLLAKRNAGVYQETTSAENILFLIPPKQIPDEYSSVLRNNNLYESDSSDTM